MFVPHIPTRPVDVYIVRISSHEAQTRLAMSLRKLVTAAGGTFMLDLMEGPGFVFKMPTAAPCPLTSHLHGGLLEEGCIHISKMRLDKEAEERKKNSREERDEDASDAESVEEDAEHSGLRMQWSWTELKRDEVR